MTLAFRNYWIQTRPRIGRRARGVSQLALLSAGAGSQNGFPFCMRWIARAVGKLLAMVGMGLEILSADVPERGNT